MAHFDSGRQGKAKPFGVVVLRRPFAWEVWCPGVYASYGRNRLHLWRYAFLTLGKKAWEWSD